MARPKAPCGTPSAYRRHRRVGEEPCEPCRAAYVESRRQERAKDAPPPVRLVPPPPPAVEPSRIEDLKRQREALKAAIWHPDGISARDLASVSRELRAVLAEIDELQHAQQSGEVVDPLDSIAGGGLHVVPLGAS